MQESAKVYNEAVKLLDEADALLIGAGAGIGVDSGLPDFRGNEGFWRAYPPMKKIGASFTDMANPDWFEKDPQIAWGFYGHRLNLYRRTEPHEGFRMLLEIGRSKPGGVFVFTSNVDGQFQKAGFGADEVVEAHGSIHHFQCIYPCSNHIWDASNETVEVDESTFRAYGDLPKCPKCGATARPNILMFGDGAWLSQRSEKQQEGLAHWLDQVRIQQWKLAIVEIGAGNAVPTVRMLSNRLFRQFPSGLLRINPREPEGPEGAIGITDGALDTLSAIYKRLSILG